MDDAFSKQDPILIELGRITVLWSLIEWILRVMLWKLSNIDQDTGIAITTHMNFPTLIYAIKSLIKLKFNNEGFTEINNVLNNVDSISAKRNTIIHSIWFRPEIINGKITYLNTHVKARGQIIKQVKNISLDELEILSSDIADTGNKLSAIASKYDLWHEGTSLQTPS